MKGKTLLILVGIAALLIIAAAVLRSGDKTPDSGEIKMGDRLFPDLPVNAVTSIRIAGGLNQVTLTKGDTGWQVMERDGYPANFDAIRELVMSFSRMKTGHNFTATPESLERLSLLPPSSESPKGRGTGVTLTDAMGKPLADVVLGEIRTPGKNRSEQYLKLSDGNTVFLVDGSFRSLKAGPEDWLQEIILNIPADAITTVIAHGNAPDAPAYTLLRPEKGGPARMTPVPSERAENPEKIAQIFETLSPLVLTDVRRAADNTLPAEGPRLVYHLDDGRTITLYPRIEGEDQYTLRVAVTPAAPVNVSDTEEASGTEQTAGVAIASETVPDQDPSAATDIPAETALAEAGAQTMAEKPVAVDDTAEKGEPIPETIGNWIFVVEKWQYDNLITNPELLLAPLAPAPK